jgi:hypothetical protein
MKMFYEFFHEANIFQDVAAIANTPGVKAIRPVVRIAAPKYVNHAIL